MATTTSYSPTIPSASLLIPSFHYFLSTCPGLNTKLDPEGSNHLLQEALPG